MTERRAYSRHGLNALKAQVKLRGFTAVDRRMVAARSLIGWRDALVSDLGGEETITAAQLRLIDCASRTALYIDHLDAWLMEQRSLVNHRRKSVLPVLRERQALVDSLSGILGQLGLERKAKPVPALSEYVADRYSGDEERRSG